MTPPKQTERQWLVVIEQPYGPGTPDLYVGPYATERRAWNGRDRIGFGTVKPFCSEAVKDRIPRRA